MGLFSHTPSAKKILSKIKQLEPRIRNQGATALYVFGMKPTGNNLPGSDLDLLVEDDEGRLGLPQLAAINEIIHEELKLNIHITTRAPLDDHTRMNIESRAQRVF